MQINILITMVEGAEFTGPGLKLAAVVGLGSTQMCVGVDDLGPPPLWNKDVSFVLGESPDPSKPYTNILEFTLLDTANPAPHHVPDETVLAVRPEGASDDTMCHALGRCTVSLATLPRDHPVSLSIPIWFHEFSSNQGEVKWNRHSTATLGVVLTAAGFGLNSALYDGRTDVNSVINLQRATETCVLKTLDHSGEGQLDDTEEETLATAAKEGEEVVRGTQVEVVILRANNVPVEKGERVYVCTSMESGSSRTGCAEVGRDRDVQFGGIPTELFVESRGDDESSRSQELTLTMFKEDGMFLAAFTTRVDRLTLSEWLQIWVPMTSDSGHECKLHLRIRPTRAERVRELPRTPTPESVGPAREEKDPVVAELAALGLPLEEERVRAEMVGLEDAQRRILQVRRLQEGQGWSLPPSGNSDDEPCQVVVFLDRLENLNYLTYQGSSTRQLAAFSEEHLDHYCWVTVDCCNGRGKVTSEWRTLSPFPMWQCRLIVESKDPVNDTLTLNFFASTSIPDASSPVKFDEMLVGTSQFRVADLANVTTLMEFALDGSKEARVMNKEASFGDCVGCARARVYAGPDPPVEYPVSSFSPKKKRAAPSSPWRDGNSLVLKQDAGDSALPLAMNLDYSNISNEEEPEEETPANTFRNGNWQAMPYSEGSSVEYKKSPRKHMETDLEEFIRNQQDPGKVTMLSQLHERQRREDEERAKLEKRDAVVVKRTDYSSNSPLQKRIREQMEEIGAGERQFEEYKQQQERFLTHSAIAARQAGGEEAAWQETAAASAPQKVKAGVTSVQTVAAARPLHPNPPNSARRLGTMNTGYW